jgi:two-component sensor histidine kinase
MRSIIAHGIRRDPADGLVMARDFDASQDRLDPTLNLMVRELQHRIRNLLSVVQCFIGQTDSQTAAEYREALLARISNLSDAYSLIERTKGHRTSLADLLEQTLKPFAAARERISGSGPDIELEPKLAFALHLTFHELATNACKYGALSCRSGQVAITWEMRSGPTGWILAVQWSERGGPPVSEPDRKGFGLRLITKVISNATVTLSFDQAGLICWLLIPVEVPDNGS